MKPLILTAVLCATTTLPLGAEPLKGSVTQDVTVTVTRTNTKTPQQIAQDRIDRAGYHSPAARQIQLEAEEALRDDPRTLEELRATCQVPAHKGPTRIERILCDLSCRFPHRCHIVDMGNF